MPNRTALVSIKRANREDANDALSSRDLSEVQQALRAENETAMERHRVRATETGPTAEAKEGGEAKSATRGSKGQAKSSKAPSSTPRPVRKYLADLGADLGGASLRTDDPRVLRVEVRLYFFPPLCSVCTRHGVTGELCVAGNPKKRSVPPGAQHNIRAALHEHLRFVFAATAQLDQDRVAGRLPIQ